MVHTVRVPRTTAASTKLISMAPTSSQGDTSTGTSKPHMNDVDMRSAPACGVCGYTSYDRRCVAVHVLRFHAHVLPLDHRFLTYFVGGPIAGRRAAAAGLSSCGRRTGKRARPNSLNCISQQVYPPHLFPLLAILPTHFAHVHLLDTVQPNSLFFIDCI